MHHVRSPTQWHPPLKPHCPSRRTNHQVEFRSANNNNITLPISGSRIEDPDSHNPTLDHRSFFDSLARGLNIRSLDDWYSIYHSFPNSNKINNNSLNIFGEKKEELNAVLSQYGHSLSRALVSIYKGILLLLYYE